MNKTPIKINEVGSITPNTLLKVKEYYSEDKKHILWVLNKLFPHIRAWRDIEATKNKLTYYNPFEGVNTVIEVGEHDVVITLSVVPQNNKVEETEAPLPPENSIDLSLLSSGGAPGLWSYELNLYSDYEDSLGSIIWMIVDDILATTGIDIYYEDLVPTLGANHLLTVTPSPTSKSPLVGELKVQITEKPIIKGTMGLRANYSGSGWYKATDSGTVFCKGVPHLQRGIFEDSDTVYTAAYYSQDIDKYGSTAALSNITSLGGFFHQSMGYTEDVSAWDVSNVTDMQDMFAYSDFNQDLSNWDVSSVTNMSGMFNGCTKFNQDINNWDVSSVTDMSNMFFHNKAFNQPIDMWDVSNVTDMHSMFAGSSVFNDNISVWNTSNVTNMNNMFEAVMKFNQDLSQWCVPKIPTKPVSFDAFVPTWTLPKPVWGTCPRGENVVA